MITNFIVSAYIAILGFFGVHTPEVGAFVPISVPGGGTGASSFTLGDCLKGNGTGALTTGSCLSSYDAFTHPAAGQSATTSLMVFNGGASSTQLSSTLAWFGGTATTSIAADGQLNTQNVVVANNKAIQFTGYSANPQLYAADSSSGLHFDGPGITSIHSTGQQGFSLSSVQRVGIGATTSPYAKLAVHVYPQDTGTWAFAIASSTSSATTTLFSINNVGTIFTSYGIGGIGSKSTGELYTYATTTYSCSSGVSCSYSNGVESFTNSGVTSIVAGDGISISGATGAVTVTETDKYRISTSSLAIGQLTYVTGTTPTGISSVATGTISSANSALTVTASRYAVGGSATFTVATTGTNMFTGTAGQVLAWGASTGWTGVATTTFSTGLTYTGATNAVTVNTSQNITTLSNLTSNGVVYTSGGGGTLNVAAFSASQIPYVNGAGTALIYTATSSLNLGPSGGGTGFTTYATGDTIYASATNVLSKLAAGTGGTVLAMSGGVPAWVATTTFSGTAPITASYSAGVVTIACATCVTSTGSAPNSKWATSTQDTNAISPNAALYVGIGTTTPKWALTISSSTGPQLALTDKSLTSDIWTFRSINNNLYIASSSASTFATTSIPLITLASTSYIGIGTTTPAKRFQVTLSQYTAANGGIQSSSDGIALIGNTPSYILRDTGNTNAEGTWGWNSTTMQFGTTNASRPLQLTTNSTARMTFTDTGQGIGTTTPRWELTVSSSTKSQLVLTDASLTSNQWAMRSINGNFYLSTSSPSTFATSSQGSFMSILSRGAIGFGSTTPNGFMGLDAGITSTTTILDMAGSVNNFLQVNVTNRSATALAESGYSATADNGSPTSNFMWMGINSSVFNNIQTYTVGGPLDTNVLGLGNDMYIANGTANKNMYFLTDGTATSTKTRLTILGGTGAVGIGTTTPFGRLTISSSTGSQLMLTDGSLTQIPWNFRSINGNLYIATSSASTFATTTLGFESVRIDSDNRFTFKKSISITNIGQSATTTYFSGLQEKSFLAASTTPSDDGSTSWSVSSSATSTFRVWNPSRAVRLVSFKCRTDANTLLVEIGTGSASSTLNDTVCKPGSGLSSTTVTKNIDFPADNTIYISFGSATTTTKVSNATLTTTWTEQKD